MTEVELRLAMPDETCDAVLFSPEPGTPLPGILHLPDIGGIREVQRAMARRLAAEGYAVLLVNPFYRSRRPPVFDFPRVMGEPRTMERLAELVGPLTPEAQRQDGETYVKLLTQRAEVEAGPVGVVGYCFGGSLALRTAAAAPKAVAAAASFHGGGLYKEGDAGSPHLVLREVAARLYFGHAVEDKSMSAEQIVAFERALAAWGGQYESETYKGARHGWTVSDNPAFNPEQAERAFGKLKLLMAEALQ